jgi:hypothetical protein
MSLRATQMFFVERFPLIDHLNNGFKEVLIQYKKVKGTDESKSFVNSLLYLNSFKISKPNSKWLEDIETSNIKNYHPFVQGRVLGICLLNAKNPQSQQVILDSATNIARQANSIDFPYFLFTFIEYALLIKHYKFVKSCLQDYVKAEHSIEGWVEFGYWEVLKIYYFIALANSDFKKEAETRSEIIVKERIAFFFRNTFWLMFLEARVTLENKLNREKTKFEIENLKTVLGYL